MAEEELAGSSVASEKILCFALLDLDEDKSCYF